MTEKLMENTQAEEKKELVEETEKKFSVEKVKQGATKVAKGVWGFTKKAAVPAATFVAGLVVAGLCKNKDQGDDESEYYEADVEVNEEVVEEIQ